MAEGQGDDDGATAEDSAEAKLLAEMERLRAKLDHERRLSARNGASSRRRPNCGSRPPRRPRAWASSSRRRTTRCST